MLMLTIAIGLYNIGLLQRDVHIRQSSLELAEGFTIGLRITTHVVHRRPVVARQRNVRSLRLHVALVLDVVLRHSGSLSGKCVTGIKESQPR